MDSLERIAMLIDADNTQVGKIGAVIRQISTKGRIVVKRAYGNWKKDALRPWEEQIKTLAIDAKQQFDYVSGKNASDMAVVIDAMDMLYRDIYDCFVLVSSDSDYTPLAIRLHDSGVYVIGVGEKKTPVSFRNACDEFVFLENLESTKKRVSKTSDGTKKKKTVTEAAAPEKAGKSKSKKKTAEESESDTPDIEEVHSLLHIAWNSYQDDDGYVNVSSAGTYIKRAMPEFDAKNYGYSKIPEILAAFPDRYEMTRHPGKGTTTIIAYRCLD